jgi:hypothetical protein
LNRQADVFCKPFRQAASAGSDTTNEPALGIKNFYEGNYLNIPAKG